MSIDRVKPHVDVVIAGAGTAGLSAALVLGRARRNVLVLNEGLPRNAPAHAAQGVFTRDGTSPLELLRIGREQLQPYTSVEVRDGSVVDVEGTNGNFRVVLDSGTEVTARKLILATGVVDELPAIEGVQELWGSGVYHCPYCHGWEVRDEPLAVYGRGASALDHVILLKGWSSDLVLCTDGPSELSDEDRSTLEFMGVPVQEDRILRLEGGGGHLRSILFESGARLERRGLFIRTKQRQRSDLAVRLNCAIDEAGFIQTDMDGRTSVPGVFAAGDVTGQPQSVISAAARGAAASGAINHELAREDVYGALPIQRSALAS